MGLTPITSTLGTPVLIIFSRKIELIDASIFTQRAQNSVFIVSTVAVLGGIRNTVGFGGGSDCANMGSGVATTVVGGWKVSLALSIWLLSPGGGVKRYRDKSFLFLLIVAKITKIAKSCNICIIAYVAELN